MVEPKGMYQFVDEGGWGSWGKKITRSRLWQKVSLLSRKAVFAETIRDGLPVVDKDDGAWTTVKQVSCRNMSEHHRRMQRVARQTRESL
jgi:hypothetical protein